MMYRISITITLVYFSPLIQVLKPALIIFKHHANDFPILSNDQLLQILQRGLLKYHPDVASFPLEILDLQ